MEKYDVNFSMATYKNKETQTQMPGTEMPLMFHWNYDMPHSFPYYMNKERQIYNHACMLRGIPVEKPDYDSQCNAKIIYRYTLEEMKSYNPYRYYHY